MLVDEETDETLLSPIFDEVEVTDEEIERTQLILTIDEALWKVSLLLLVRKPLNFIK